MDLERYKTDIYSLAESTCNRYRANTLMHFEDKQITYGEFLVMIRRRAAFLQQKGFKKGDSIGMMAINSPEWCATFIAILAIGGTVLPFDTSLQSAQLDNMLKAAKAKAIFVSSAFKKLIKSKTVTVFEIESEKCYGKEEKFKSVKIPYENTAALLFTSGTTGTPKMVMLSHKNILNVACVCSEFEEFVPEDVILALLPLFHVYALEACFLAPFVTGGSIVLLNSLKGPDIMKALGEYPITIFPAAPVMWELFFKALVAKIGVGSAKYYIFMFFAKNAPKLRKIGLGFLVEKIFTPVHEAFGLNHRFFISGGAPLKKEYFTYFKNMGFNFIEGYGLSETSGPIAIPYYKTSVAGSVGNAIPGNEIKIININEDGIGEIWGRGDCVMKGYHNNPKANAEVFDSEGFFNTGDLGRVDKKNNLFVTGRVKNVIVLDSGKNVYPEELEFYFKQSNMISEIAVIDQEVQGHTQIYAVINPVVKSQELYPKMKQEIETLNKGLPEYRRVHHFAISLDELPKNSTRKLLYNEIKKLLAAGNYQTSESDSAVLKDVLTGTTMREEEAVGFLRVYLKQDVLFANQSLSDFNIDSLGLIDLLTSLEAKLKIDIDIKEIWKKQNLLEMVTYVGSIDAGSASSLDDKMLRGPIKKKPRKFYNPLYHVFVATIGFLSRRFWNVTIENRERIEMDNAILVSNHQSYLDMIWLSFSIPSKYRKNIYVTGKRKFAFLRFFFPVFPVLYLDDTNSVDVIKSNADLLRQGKSLLIFPEGTRTETGKVAPFKSGAAYLAWHLNKRVIPVGINGAFEIYPRTKRFPKLFTKQHGKIKVGMPVSPEKYKSVEEFNNTLEKEVKNLVDLETVSAVSRKRA